MAHSPTPEDNRSKSEGALYLEAHIQIPYLSAVSTCQQLLCEFCAGSETMYGITLLTAALLPHIQCHLNSLRELHYCQDQTEEKMMGGRK